MAEKFGKEYLEACAKASPEELLKHITEVVDEKAKSKGMTLSVADRVTMVAAFKNELEAQITAMK